MRKIGVYKLTGSFKMCIIYNVILCDVRGGVFLEIVRGSNKRIPDMKALWLEAFPDDSEFVHVFFEKFYRPSKALLRYDNGELVSMLFYMDVKMKANRRVLKGAYLYGVATKLTERHAGHFSALHEVLTERLTEKKYKFVCAIPASDSLFSMYKKFGYNTFFRRTEYSITTLDFDTLTPEQAWERRLDAYKKSKRGIKLLESREMFIESTKGHLFLGFDGGYFAFAKKGGSYKMYEVCDPEGAAPPHELVHYERSGVLLDLGAGFDEDAFEKEKPCLNYLMN